MGNFNTKLSPERYLNNKEYFDSGLIACVENQKKKIEKLTSRNLFLESTVEADKNNIVALKLKISNLNAMVFKLQSDKKEDDETIRELREAIRQLRSEINETVDRLTIEKGELQKEVNNLHKERLNLQVGDLA